MKNLNRVYIICEYYSNGENYISMHTFSTLEKAEHFRQEYNKLHCNDKYYIGCTHCSEVE